MDINYPENPEQAARIARAALPLASQYNLPANPLNYRVFYEYIAGYDPDFTRAAQQAMQDPHKVTQDQIYDLYNQFILQGDEAALETMREALRVVMEQALRTLAEAGEDTSSYQLELENGMAHLSGGMGLEELRGVLNQVIDHTKRTLEAGRSLQNRLTAANQELESLRCEFQKVREESVRDPLTGVHNRRGFDLAVESLSRTAKDMQTPLCLLMVDADHFKKINDQYGHGFGDEVLRFIANTIIDKVRGADLVARYGGEEFVVLLPETALEGAARVATNIAQKLAQSPLKQKSTGTSIGAVTVSIGVATFRYSESTDELVARADKALYQAKSEGRNRVIIAKSA